MEGRRKMLTQIDLRQEAHRYASEAASAETAGERKMLASHSKFYESLAESEPKKPSDAQQAKTARSGPKRTEASGRTLP
jgi:hypothetical protein